MELVIVAIPYSTGLLLQAVGRSSETCVFFTSQSPIQRVYCCKPGRRRRLEHPIQKVAIPYSTGLLLQVPRRHVRVRVERRRSQSPIQRVYCCKNDDRIFIKSEWPEVAIPYSTGLLLQGSRVDIDGSVGDIESQSPIQRVYCCKSSPNRDDKTYCSEVAIPYSTGLLLQVGRR